MIMYPGASFRTIEREKTNLLAFLYDLVYENCIIKSTSHQRATKTERDCILYISCAIFFVHIKVNVKLHDIAKLVHALYNLHECFLLKLL